MRRFDAGRQRRNLLLCSHDGEFDRAQRERVFCGAGFQHRCGALVYIQSVLPGSGEKADHIKPIALEAGLLALAVTQSRMGCQPLIGEFLGSADVLLDQNKIAVMQRQAFL